MAEEQGERTTTAQGVTPGAVPWNEAAAVPQAHDLHEGRRLPLIARAYGVLVIVAGAIGVPATAIQVIYAVREIIAGHVHVDALALPFILSCLQAIVLVVNGVCLVVFGGFLVRNHRHHAARWAYILMVPTILEVLIYLSLEGVTWYLLIPVAQLAILAGLSVLLDPALLQERRLQRALRRMDERDEYERALAAGMLGRDESGKGYIELDVFNIFWLFVVGSVFGLALETTYRYLMYGIFEDRAGLLWGPFSPIYGFGAVLLTVFLNRLWKANPAFIMLASALIGGGFEYLTSWFMEVAFGITAWDYTGAWLSIGGRTSGKYLIFWGVLGYVWIRWMLPRLLWLINLIPWKVRYIVTAIGLVLIVLDGLMTLMALDCWYGRVSGAPQDAPITRFFATYFDDGFMQHRFQTMQIDPTKSGRR